MTGSRQQPEPTPSGLDLPGKRLWKRITTAYELREDELVLLDQACRVADTLARLEDGMRGAPLIVTGSMGQQREHPLLSEARQQRALLGRLVAQLKIPDEGGISNRSTQARKAAQVRWSRKTGA